MISIIIALVLAEAIARSLNIKPYQTRLERYEFDETLGWKTRNSTSTYISKRRYAHPLYYNNDGFPSTKADAAKSASRKQPSVALIGDSFVEGYYLPYEQTFANILRQSTGKQVLNLGVSGYSPGQYLLSARKHLPDYNVTDIVVFLFAFNDIPYVNRDMYRGYAKPLVSDETFEIVNFPLEKIEADETNSRNIFKTVLDQFAIWSLVKPLFVFAGQGDDTVLEPEKLDTHKLHRALKLIARINGENPQATFHVYYIPDITELKTEGVFQFNIANFAQQCKQMELSCIMPEPFTEHDVDSLFIPEDHHLSALGAQLVAQQISEVLANKSPVRPTALNVSLNKKDNDNASRRNADASTQYSR